MVPRPARRDPVRGPRRVTEDAVLPVRPPGIQHSHNGSAASRSAPGMGWAGGLAPWSRWRQDRYEVPDPADQELVGRALLAGDRGGQRAPRAPGDVQLDPLGVDVKLHGPPCAAARAAALADMRPAQMSWPAASCPL